METYPALIRTVIEQLRKLPGIGTKSAERLVNYFLKMDDAEMEEFTGNLKRLKENIRLCRECFNIAEEELCPVCKDTRREKVLAIVEEVKDLAALEKAGFRGCYHVLGGRINPLERTGPEQLNLVTLVERISRNGFTEVLVATNPTPEGETTASYLVGLLKEHGIPMSRLAYGLPMGGEIEYADPETVRRSIENRRKA
jgi:recombination protein RecR